MGGEIGNCDAFRLVEPEMSDEEHQANRAVWWNEFPCRCASACLCQGTLGRRPMRVRIFVEFPEEPPQLTPTAARTLLSLLQTAADKQKREADRDS